MITPFDIVWNMFVVFLTVLALGLLTYFVVLLYDEY